MWDYSFDIQLNNPLEQEKSPCKFIFLHLCFVEITTLHRAKGEHALLEAQIAAYYSSSLHGGRTRLSEAEAPLLNPREPN